MQHSLIGLLGRTLSHRSRARQLAICACTLAALVAGGAAHAHTRWHYRPAIWGAPATTDVAGTAYSFTPSAHGPTGYKLTFAVSGKPSWANFNTATGQLSGTPTAAGRFANIVIRVSDGMASASLAAFTITVSASAAATPPPTISGTPATTDVAGTAYTFTPQASDTNGAPLSFSVQNLPSWGTFSIATGTLSGTPATTNTGTYSNIVISVSNGTGSAALAPFSITVSQPSATTGSATLSWAAPVENTNGSALTDLAGYNIYYGTSPTAMTTVVNIASAGTTTYTVNNLAAGTWYFAVNAYTTSGTDSGLSSTGSKTIP